jgi:hypothetical protein
MCMARAFEVWQVRLDAETATALRDVAAVLGLPNARTDLLKAGLRLLQKQAEEEAMAQGVDAFYGDEPVPLAAGVRRSTRRPASE